MRHFYELSVKSLESLMCFTPRAFLSSHWPHFKCFTAHMWLEVTLKALTQRFSIMADGDLAFMQVKNRLT